MAKTAALRTVRIALAGNPNSGKTTLFNMITGAHQKTGNYAGVTVEIKEGRHREGDVEFIVYDLPGTYSLASYSPEELTARRFLDEVRPDAIIDVLDATNLQRNLYLLLQFRELGLPVVGALNMSDQTEGRGIRIDHEGLGALLGIPLVPTVGTRNRGVRELFQAVLEAIDREPAAPRTISYGAKLEAEIEKLSNGFLEHLPETRRHRWLALRLLEGDADVEAQLAAAGAGAVVPEARAARARLESGGERTISQQVSEHRYAYIHGAVAETVRLPGVDRQTRTEQIDRILLNRALGLPLLFLVVWGLFQLTFTLGQQPIAWLEDGFAALGDFAAARLPEGWGRSLVVDGIIGGIGGVFSFVPLIVLLFLGLSFLEDTGYMARAAFLMDRFLHSFGLHGQSFLPLLLGFGCSVPAILASRTLKNRRDRILTVLVTPLFSCGAKLPVYMLLAGAFFPEHAGSVVFSMYLVGIVLALLAARLLRRTVLPAGESPFVMELPPYRMPTARMVLWHVVEKTWLYVRKAGTIILFFSVLVWVATRYPEPPVPGPVAGHAQQAEAATDGTPATREPLAAIESSFAGRLGRFLEPIFRPIGFDWKLTIALLTGAAAKEVTVSTLAVLYRTGEEETPDGETPGLRRALAADPAMSPLVGWLFMLFTLVVFPCAATLAVVRSELGMRWLVFMMSYLAGGAWLLCFLVYQGARLLAG